MNSISSRHLVDVPQNLVSGAFVFLGVGVAAMGCISLSKERSSALLQTIAGVGLVVAAVECKEPLHKITQHVVDLSAQILGSMSGVAMSFAGYKAIFQQDKALGLKFFASSIALYALSLAIYTKASSKIGF